MRSLALILIFLCYSSVHAQNLLTSRQSSYFTYLYKLSEKEAHRIYKNDLWVVDSSYFHTIVDSFPTDSQFQKRLVPGHYLETSVNNNQQEISIFTEATFDIKILNNQRDLLIQVIDSEGYTRSDAKIKLKLRKIRFDSKTNAYRIKKSNHQGLLQVNLEGQTVYHTISREYNNSALKRLYRNVVYRSPFKYVLKPINYIIRLPIDGTKSIIRGGTYGVIYRTKTFFVNAYEKTACLFDSYYCEDVSQKHKGYLVFNKPIYRPGDTVKFKAFIVKKKSGKALKKNVNVYLKNKKLTELSPYNKGAYEYSFPLHDSLKLELDSRVYLKLGKETYDQYISNSFKYEDYELGKIQLTLSATNETHLRGQEQKLFIKATDDNELLLQDARAEILISPLEIESFFVSETYVPDTLLFKKMSLSPSEETEFSIPDSIFPPSNMSYNVRVNVLTSDNESLTENKKLTYNHSNEKLEISLINDSLLVSHLKNGLRESSNVTITAFDAFGNPASEVEASLPLRLAANPYFHTYEARSEGLSNKLELSAQPSLLACSSQRTPDSLYIKIANPRNIPFSYFLYRHNQELERGHAETLDIRRAAHGKKNYSIAIQYVWGGKVREENYNIPLYSQKLNIKVTQPKLVYPGQETNIQIQVSDQKEKPVSNVDLTAYAITSKFDAHLPELPYLGKKYPNRTLINEFNKASSGKRGTKNTLDYKYWSTKAGLDSISHYQFIFARDSIYRFSYASKDSITQFAPFIFKQGKQQTIHVIYIDNRPVYFSWSTHTRPYSFRIEAGFHQISLRTLDREYSIDSLYFGAGEKHIISLSSEYRDKNIKVEPKSSELSYTEKRNLYPFIFPYRYNFPMYSYLKYDDQVAFLRPASQGDSYQRFRNTVQLAGPIPGWARFKQVKGFNILFDHEPFYLYTFSSRLLKMKSIEKNQYYPSFLNQYYPVQRLEDEVFTEELIAEMWQDHVEQQRRKNQKYTVSKYSSPGAGKLLLSIVNQDRPILNIIILQPDKLKSMKVHRGIDRFFHDLMPGNYRILFLFEEGQYQLLDSVSIKANGLNFLETEIKEVLPEDDFSREVNTIINEKTLNHTSLTKEDLRPIQKSYRKRFNNVYIARLIQGQILDDQGEPLPGVVVIIKDTDIGTITDERGYYSLTVPAGHNELSISYLGYNSMEVDLSLDSYDVIRMEQSELMLDEVVVTAYSVRRERSKAYSVAVINSDYASAFVSSDSVSSYVQGRAAGVQIEAGTGEMKVIVRGNSTLFNEKPLIIINGKIFSGDPSTLKEDFIANISVLKGAEAANIYGSRARNGVMIINTRDEAFLQSATVKGAEFDQAFLEAASNANSIRQNFSDYAFWQARLTTDEQGKASFTVTYPDDISSWQTIFMAMNDHQQSGQASEVVKSYKPLMAQLAVPRFLLAGDSSQLIGKVLNYTSDSMTVKTRFSYEDIELEEKVEIGVNPILDTLALAAETDSLELTYVVEAEDGYLDGEKRNIPVFPKGLNEAIGEFHVLSHDTVIQPVFKEDLGSVRLEAVTNVLELIEDEIIFLQEYEYWCNEQIASKLKGLLALKRINQDLDKAFEYEKEVKKLLRLLKKNAKNNGTWGWWADSETSYWISLHVIEAIIQAQTMGYEIDWDKATTTRTLVSYLERKKGLEAQLNILRMLELMDAKVEYKRYLPTPNFFPPLSLRHKLVITELQQLSNQMYDLKWMQSYRQETMLGNAFYQDSTSYTSILDNNILNTVAAYHILRQDSLDHTHELQKIRQYLLESRSQSHWRNTYESALIIETILPDLLNDSSKIEKPRLEISGDIEQVVESFPFHMDLNAEDQISISKKGSYPVYLSTYQEYWNTNPELKENDFIISSSFEQVYNDTLEAGKEVRLKVKLEVKKDADYVMVNIPIPAGCSYANKSQQAFESHREYFKHKTSIFLQHLSAGTYEFYIDLLPRYRGVYHINPAKVELMYFPTQYANNRVNSVSIK